MFSTILSFETFYSSKCIHSQQFILLLMVRMFANVWYLEPHDEGVRRIVIRGFLELYCLWEEYLMQRGHCGR